MNGLLIQRSLLVVLCLAAIALPLIAEALGMGFYVSLFSRVLIWALLATSLNMLVGMGGMVSMGHAAFYGAGAYVVGILARDFTALSGALVAWPLAMLVTALLALAIGMICLRTRGVYFIMITLAFAQMLFYVFVSLKGYGGEDGLAVSTRSAIGTLDMHDDRVFYYVVLALLAVTLILLARLRTSRFGTVLRGIRDNEIRMQSLGYPTFRYKLTAFVIAGAFAGLAGALMANQNEFVSPNMLHWELSGTALVMVILGGLGNLWGGLIGAAVFLLLEEVFTAFTTHWQIALGLVLLAIVFWAPRGVAGLFARRAA